MKKIFRNLIERVGIQSSNNRITTFVQFIKFGIVGVSNTVLGYLIYLLILFALHFLDFSFDLYVASFFSFILSVLWAFYWNNRFVFKSSRKRSIWKSLLKTYLSYGFTGLILSNVLLFVWTSILLIPKEVAPILSLIITVPLNFLLNKFWAFRMSEEKDNSDVNEDSLK